jgi:hypothetical protein
MSDSVGPHPVVRDHPRKGGGIAPDEIRKYRTKLIGDWTLVKRASFNAAKRLERKHAASLMGLAFAGCIGFTMPYFTTLFEPSISKHTKNVLDFVSYITSGLSLCVGLVEQARDYTAKARKFHLLGLEVNSALRKLRGSDPSSPEAIATCVEKYENALARFDVNHDNIDRWISEAEERVLRAKRETESIDILHELTEGSPERNSERLLASAEVNLSRLQRTELIQIYWLYWAVWSCPALIGGFVWWKLMPVS